MPPKAVEATSAQGKSRKLTPKERGCFQCSRCRIICDKAEPSCGKCIKKGIDCSGVNRIRFTEGVARRGRLKDCKIPDVRDDAASNLPSTTAFPQVRWPDERNGGTTRKKDVRQNGVTAITSPTQKSADSYETIDDSVSAFSAGVDVQFYVPTNTPDFPLQFVPEQDDPTHFEEDVEEIIRTNDMILQHNYSNHTSLQPWIAPVDAGTRMLFSYFSEAIAPVMVVLDTASNGYREVILPMALENEILRRTVTVVAAQHLSRHVPKVRDAAEASRSIVISHLRQQSETATEDQVFNKFTWATLIILLVGETVTGSPTCAFVLRMLLCLAENSRTRNENSTVARFLQTQTNMFELMGMPLWGEEEGIPTIEKSFHIWQNWLSHEQYSTSSQDHNIFNEVRQCFDAACSIYVRRATCPSPSLSKSHYHRLQDQTIRSLISRLYAIPPHTPGAHALVWPCFVAGAEASDPEQRKFFVQYMQSIYKMTNFRNIPIAVQSLEALWEVSRSGAGGRWTQYLPEVSKVLVM